MTGLRLDHFIQAAEDFEGAQYRILSGLQQARQAFTRNVIYPHLSELINLYSTLHTIVQQLEDIREAIPGSITGVDPNSYQIIYEKPSLDPSQMGQVEDLIRWTMPHLQAAIDEGRTIFEFVEENLHMEEVGILPSYVEEGYLMLPDCLDHQLHVFQYSLSVFTHTEERFRSLKTTYVKSIAQGVVVREPRSAQSRHVFLFYRSRLSLRTDGAPRRQTQIDAVPGQARGGGLMRRVHLTSGEALL